MRTPNPLAGIKTSQSAKLNMLIAREMGFRAYKQKVVCGDRISWNVLWSYPPSWSAYQYAIPTSKLPDFVGMMYTSIDHLLDYSGHVSKDYNTRMAFDSEADVDEFISKTNGDNQQPSARFKDII